MPVRKTGVNTTQIELAVKQLLTAIGEDVRRPGLVDTPARVARFWKEFIDHPAGTKTMFAEAKVDDLIAVTGIETWSLCEHHLLPFHMDISVAYLPRGKVLGLSKFARIAHEQSHKLQMQERLVRDIADAIVDITGTPDVAAVGSGEHLCMAMRGVKTPASMKTSVMLGQFRYHGPLREEFLTLAGYRK